MNTAHHTTLLVPANRGGRKSSTNSACGLLLFILALGPAALSQGVGEKPNVGPDAHTTQDLQRNAGPAAMQSDAPTAQTEIKGTVKVTVEADKARGVMAPRALAVETHVSDQNVVTVAVLNLLKGAGVTTLRYPGGGYADNYHWSTYKPTNSQATIAQRFSNFAANNDFGHIVALADHLGTLVITVNYGSNQEGTGGGEPAEAAAWVAYANGSPTDSKAIGKDSIGYDWQTVGYWASLRAAQPIPTDDGKNFLRIAHPQPLNVLYWEVGNEVYLNGYYGGEGEEVDFHAPYPKDSKDTGKDRQKNPNLSPEAYGKAVVEFAKAMKAVDPKIKIGASIDLPVVSDWNIQEWTQDPITGQYSQRASVEKKQDSGVEWDRGVMKTAGKDIDFVALHWYTGATTEASGFKDLNDRDLLTASETELPKIMNGILELYQKYCGKNAQNMQLLVTGVVVKPYIKVPDPLVPGLFATDAYLNLMQYGAVNIDWTELQSGGFLDDKFQPGSAYYGMQMVHFLMNYREPLVATTSSNALLSAYAAKHANEGVTLMLINKDPKNTATVKVNISGAKLATSGMRFDYGKASPPADNMVQSNPIDNVGNSFTTTVPPYTVSDILMPKQ
jgi:alpha-L-arabinofuranosidase